jgi:hypothetical protein
MLNEFTLYAISFYRCEIIKLPGLKSYGKREREL